MTINLPDLRQAVTQYIRTVTTTVSPLRADSPNAISPGEYFTFDVTATNPALPAGIRLINIGYRITIGPANLALLEVPAHYPVRAAYASTAPALVPGTMVSSMYVFPPAPDDVLGTGQSYKVANLRGRALALGQVTITVDIRALPDLTYLFPHDDSINVTRVFKVV